MNGSIRPGEQVGIFPLQLVQPALPGDGPRRPAVTGSLWGSDSLTVTFWRSGGRRVTPGYDRDRSALLFFNDGGHFLCLLFVRGECLSPEADSECSQCQTVPDASRARLIGIVWGFFYWRRQRVRHADRVTHLRICCFMKGHRENDNI